MSTLKRVVAGVVIAVSIVVIAVSVVGIFYSWSLNTPLTQAITRALTGAEQVLAAADTGLERVNTRLGEAQTAVVGVEERVQSAGDTITETSIVYEVLDRTVGDELFPKIEAARDTVQALAGSLVAFNATLEAMNEVPFVNVPTITTELETAGARLEETRTAVVETRDELRAIKAEAVSRPVTAITSRTSRITTGLAGAQTAIDETQSRIAERNEQLAQLKDRVRRTLDWISVGLTVLFLWVILADASLIVQAVGVLRGYDPVEPVRGPRRT